MLSSTVEVESLGYDRGFGREMGLESFLQSGKDLEKGRFGASEPTIQYVFPPIQVSRTAAFFASAMLLAIN